MAAIPAFPAAEEALLQRPEMILTAAFIEGVCLFAVVTALLMVFNK